MNIKLDKSFELIKATYVQNFTFDNGKKLTGNNITIAIIDTGVDYTHRDLGCVSENCEISSFDQNHPNIHGDKISWSNNNGYCCYYARSSS